MEPWELLLADIESEAQASRRYHDSAEAEELRRGDEARTALAERLYAMRGRSIEIDTGDGWRACTVLDCASEWMLGRLYGGQCVIPLRAVLAVRGLERADELRGCVARLLPMTSALRALAQSAAYVRLIGEGATYEGTLMRVGLDYVEIAAGSGTLAVPLARLRRCEEMSGSLR